MQFDFPEVVFKLRNFGKVIAAPVRVRLPRSGASTRGAGSIGSSPNARSTSPQWPVNDTGGDFPTSSKRFDFPSVARQLCARRSHLGIPKWFDFPSVARQPTPRFFLKATPSPFARGEATTRWGNPHLVSRTSPFARGEATVSTGAKWPSRSDGDLTFWD